MKFGFNASAILAVVGAFASSTAAEAQAPSREEVTPPVPERAQDNGAVKIDSRGALARPACPLDSSDITTNITEVRYTGPNGTPLPAALVPLLQGLGGAGADQPIKVVCDIRDKANAALRASRYVASVQIPPQKIDDGVLKLEVVTARIVEMRVRGDAGPYEKLLAGRIELLKKLDPLNEAQAEELLLLAGDVPGLDVQLSLRPAASAPGDVIGEMTVVYRRFSMIGNIQNYNSKQLGRETAYVRGEYYGLTGSADMTYLGLSATVDFKEQKIAQFGHVMGVGSHGASVAARFTFALSDPSVQNLDLRTRSIITSLEYSRPLVRSLTKNAAVTTGFEFAEQRTKVGTGAGKTPLNRDRISTLFARIGGDMRALRQDGQEKSRLSGMLELRQGLNVLGSTGKGAVTASGYSPSRFDGSARATIVRAQVDTVYGLGKIFDLATSLRGQWSNKALLNFDEFSVGNLTLGRGFDPGANGGDRAVGTSIELRAKLLRQGNTKGEVFGFFDGVRLWNKDPASTERNRVLRSYGAGARIALPGQLLLEVTYAHAKDRALLIPQQPKPPKDRILFSLTAQLVPFGGRR
jgi:hemolysin activation/secretion protein